MVSMVFVARLQEVSPKTIQNERVKYVFPQCFLLYQKQISTFESYHTKKVHNEETNAWQKYKVGVGFEPGTPG